MNFEKYNVVKQWIVSAWDVTIWAVPLMVRAWVLGCLRTHACLRACVRACACVFCHDLGCAAIMRSYSPAISLVACLAGFITVLLLCGSEFCTSFDDGNCSFDSGNPSFTLLLSFNPARHEDKHTRAHVGARSRTYGCACMHTSVHRRTNAEVHTNMRHCFMAVCCTSTAHHEPSWVETMV